MNEDTRIVCVRVNKSTITSTLQPFNCSLPTHHLVYFCICLPLLLLLWADLLYSLHLAGLTFGTPGFLPLDIILVTMANMDAK